MDYDYYNNLSLDELQQILETIDKEKHPERVELIKQVITDKGEDPEAYAELRGIGGWLILPLIGLVITACFHFYFIVTEIYPVFSDGTIFALFDTQSDICNPVFGIFILFESAATILMFWLAIIILYMGFKESKKFVLLLIVFYICSFLISAIYYMTTSYFEVIESVERELLIDLLRSIIVAAIWIPYLLVSERVKNTFIY